MKGMNETRLREKGRERERERKKETFAKSTFTLRVLSARGHTMPLLSSSNSRRRSFPEWESPRNKIEITI